MTAVRLRYHRVAVLVREESDPAPALAELRRVAPGLETRLIIAQTPAAIDRLQEALAPDERTGPETTLAVARDAAEVARLVEVHDLELVVDGIGTLASATLLANVRRRHPVALLWPRGGEAELRAPVREIACVAIGSRDRRPLGTFLRDRLDPSMRVTALTSSPIHPEALAARMQVAGVDATVELPRTSGSLRGWLTAWTPQTPFDLLVFARLPAAVLLARRWPAPMLLLPPVPAPPSLRPIDVPDVVDDGGPLRVRVDHTLAVGDLPPVPDQELTFVTRGAPVAQVRTSAGEAVLPAQLAAESLGVYRGEESSAPDPLAAVEQEVVIVRPGPRPLILFDAALDPETLGALAALEGPPVPDRLAVRLRPTQSSRSIRERLHAAGLPPRVIDARAVLDEGEALDVSEANDPVRLARVGARLQARGFPVIAVLPRGGQLSLSPPSPAEFPVIAGNAVEIELDNHTGRRWLLDALRASRRSILFQVYMASDDEVAREVEAALVEAAGRGVTVRILVDSLFALHGSFGVDNPLLTRLGQHPGVTVRAVRPVKELPSLVDLKQRDHRKLVVVDAEVALVGGRNLSREYYLGFDEVPLGPSTPWPMVPWLDAGIRLEGPAVAAVTQSFLEAWADAGGEPFAVSTPPPRGDTPARVIVHHGLRDANTLDAYRTLFDSATSHIYLVNNFPLVLELQHALLEALRRGVRVCALIGHVVPTHGGEPFQGLGSLARHSATSLVHSRFDPLIEAGAECYLFEIPAQPDWAPGFGPVVSHVHAKVITIDGRVCTVGSANLDITSAYWESELIVEVPDEAVARAVETRIDSLLAGAPKIDPADPAWQQTAKRRAWMRRWPGVLSI